MNPVQTVRTRLAGLFPDRELPSDSFEGEPIEEFSAEVDPNTTLAYDLPDDYPSEYLRPRDVELTATAGGETYPIKTEVSIDGRLL